MILFFIFILNQNNLFSQESQTIKKIIIEDNTDGTRLLSPPTETKKERIKLIPPKSIIEKEKEKQAEQERKKEQDLRRKTDEQQKEIEIKLKAEEQKKNWN